MAELLLDCNVHPCTTMYSKMEMRKASQIAMGKEAAEEAFAAEEAEAARLKEAAVGSSKVNKG